MTESLKTLKDLEHFLHIKPLTKARISVGTENPLITDSWNQRIVQPDDLRLEAQKWAKFFKRYRWYCIQCKKGFVDWGVGGNNSDGCKKMVAHNEEFKCHAFIDRQGDEWIEMFFNLKENKEEKK